MKVADQRGELTAGGERTSVVGTHGLLHRMRHHSLLRNSGMMMAATAVNLALGYVYWIVAARAYSVQDVGLGAALLAAMTLAWTISSLGIGNSVVQLLPGEAAGRRFAATVNAAILVAAALGVLVALAIAGLAPALGSDFDVLWNDPAYLIAFVLGTAAIIVADIVDKVFIAERSSGRMLARNTVFSAVKILLLVVPVLAVGGGLGIVVSWSAGAALSILVAIPLLFQLRRGYQLSLAGTRGRVRSVLRTAAGHHIVSVGNLAPGYLLPLVVAGLLSTTDNGYFYTTWRVGGIFFIVSASVGVSLFAEGSQRGSRLGASVKASVAIIAGLLVPTVLATLLLGHQILAVLGPEYASHGYSLLLILAISAIPDAITNVYIAVLRVQRRFRFAAFLTLGMAVVTVVAGALLLEPYGIAGAGLGWLLAQCLGSLLVGADLLVQRRSRRLGAAPLAGVSSD